MDIARPDLLEKKKKRQLAWAAAAIGFVVLATLGVSRLKPAAPSVERATLVIDTVKRGEMVREVRGLGTLVPEEIRWIPAVTQGRVERLVLLPGVTVTADSVVLELSNPELEMQALEAESRAELQGPLHRAQGAPREPAPRPEGRGGAGAGRVAAGAPPGRRRRRAGEEQGLVAAINLKLSQSAADELEHREGIEWQRLAIAGQAIDAQMASSRPRSSSGGPRRGCAARRSRR